MDKLFDKITFEDTQGHPFTYKVWDSDAARKISDFTTAERRQNLMSGDGYNTIYAKLSKWYEDFKPVVWSGSYNDLVDKPTIPVVNNGTLEIQKNGTSVAVYSANSALNVIANIIVPEINDNVASATSLYSSQKIDDLIRGLGMNIIDGGDVPSPIEIPSDVISQITNTIINKIESGEIDIPSGGESVDYNQIYDYINQNLPIVNNGRLNITINGIAALTQNGNLLPVGSNYFSANQAENYDLDIVIPEVSAFIDDTIEVNNKTWSSQKIKQEIITNGSLKMVVLGDDSDLPSSGEANTIYFKRATDSEDGENKYYEWVWVNDSWENIGKQVIDLSEYAKKEDIGNATIKIVETINNDAITVGQFTTNEKATDSPHIITIPIPTIGNGVITIVQGTDSEEINGEIVETPHVIATFSVNQTGDTTITLPEVEKQEQSDWEENDATKKSYIKNKPEINNGTLTITVGGNSYTFTANQKTNQNIEIPAQEQSDWEEADSTKKSFIKNKPTIPEAQVNSDWNSETGVSRILNKPILARVATSGSYNDLSDTPEIPEQVQADWNQSDSSASDYIKNKPSFAGIKVVDASGLTNGILQTNADVNDLVVLANTSSSVTYTYTNNAGTEKHLKGNPDYDIVFRYCGNNRFQPITLPIPID